MSANNAASAAQAVVQIQEPVKYTCAACLSEQQLAFDKPLLCTQCSTRQATSRIFFKKRKAEPTLYDTN
jgi:hypothetical protein